MKNTPKQGCPKSRDKVDAKEASSSHVTYNVSVSFSPPVPPSEVKETIQQPTPRKSSSQTTQKAQQFSKTKSSRQAPKRSSTRHHSKVAKNASQLYIVVVIIAIIVSYDFTKDPVLLKLLEKIVDVIANIVAHALR